MLLLNKTVKTVQYPTCISFIENKNKIYELKKNALRKFKCFSSDEIEILKNNM